MINEIGFACLSKVLETGYKEFRLSSFSKELLNKCIYHNLIQTNNLIDYCKSKGYGLLRLSSKIVPFGNHKIMEDIEWWDSQEEFLYMIGEKARNFGIKLSIHPSQMCVLNSPDKKIVNNAIRDMVCHYMILKGMRIKGNIVLHVGGKYDNKKEAIIRFIDTYHRLPKKLRKLIVLENDDKSYTINDVLSIHDEIGVPVVLDIHHHICYNDGSKLDVKRVMNTWENRIPKVHLSSPKSIERPRDHAEYVDFNYCKHILNELNKYPYDLMIEAKQKDLAVDRFIEDYNNEYRKGYINCSRIKSRKNRIIDF